MNNSQFDIVVTYDSTTEITVTNTVTPKPPVEPPVTPEPPVEPPVTPELPELPVKPSITIPQDGHHFNHQDNGQSQSDQLPQTGIQITYLAMTAGIFLVLLGALVLVRKMRKVS
ncbi:LPXTG cell wall anchor domain-containing protein [Kurthia sibirica]|uniref:Gram-positive cocci surface proteins LPxTG domain-containing protein n=1 Tax=Kurthia sibirica TaxID=202750 RepID=A0A2U3AMG4_9BACL|nr:LPXTG cell wall anchor domain-containing protein [Kurthia sibirica]PWI25716.1 hypothetical protein DEX24_07345 [Kurthia sibirica]GEK33724.1 hypothetical protein KSI01_12570 [Kurthia sibirica]